ncbi:MAG: hypothetical protein ACK45B_14030 [Limisphaerales bacterium]
MALTPSTMLPLGTPLPDFQLPNLDGHHVSPRQFSAAPALVVLITGGSLGAALLAAVLCLPISGPIMAAVFGAATELFGPKH